MTAFDRPFVAPVWRGSYSAAITFSLASYSGREHALRQALAASPYDGGNVTYGDGIWRGRREPSATIELCGDEPPAVAEIVSALIAAGCEAVQVARHGRRGYDVQEWRQV